MRRMPVRVGLISSRFIPRQIKVFLLALLLVVASSAKAAQPTDPSSEPPKPQPKQTTTLQSSSLAAGADPQKIPGVSLGAFKRNSSGAGTYSVPISVPPGTGGVVPNLAFTYNSQSDDNGLLGLSWSLTGLPTVHRCAATTAQDGFQGTINYDSNDRFCLDGQRLMAISGSYGGNGTEYRTEVDTFIKVISYGTAGSGPAYFKGWTKAGEVLEFGATGDSRIEAQGKASVRVWALNKVQDSKGNYLTISYTEDNANGEYRLSRIDYTGNSGGGLAPQRSVTFSYGSRSDIIPLYVGGSLIRTTVLLTSVKTYVGTTLVRDYRVAYENGTATGRSRLRSITECAGDGACLPANTLSWQEGGTGFPASSAWGSGTSSLSDVGDFNGDGKMDHVYADGGNIYVKLSTGSGFAPSQVWGTYSGNGYHWVGDFNGDGKTDYAFGDNLTISVYLSTGSSFSAPQVWGTGYSSNSQIADFNGDGRADHAYADGGNIYVKRSTGNGFTANQVWGTYSGNGYHWVGDFNGDRMIDWAFGDNYNIYVYLSTGSSFTAPQIWGTGYSSNSFIADFNGDDRSDHLYADGGNIYVKLSTSAGFTTNQLWGTYSGAGYHWVGDFNGDGKVDYAFGDGGNIYVYRSTGSSFSAPQIWGTGYSSETHIADFNGDGKADHAYENAGNVYVKVVNAPFPDLITSITNSIGGQTTISYKPITDSTVYTKDNDAAYPNADLQYPLYVVASRTVSDGLGTNYSFTHQYGGLKVHLQGRGLLGFRWLDEVDNSAGAKDTTYFNQNFPLTGLPSTSEIRNASGALFTQIVDAYSTANPYPGVSLVTLSRLDHYACDGGGSCRQTARTMEYDTYGNLTRTYHLGNVALNGDERDERTDWVVDTTNWLHRPSRAALYDSAGSLLRERWFSYDGLAWGYLGSRGLLTREESRLGGPLGHAGNPVVTHNYDTFGNRTSTTDPRGCATSATYDSTYRTFPATVTTCLNHTTSFQYDARWGVLTSQTDPNNQTTTSTYDGFGRLTKVTGPLDTGSTYGTVSHFYYDWGNPNLQRIVTYRTEQHGTANVLWTEDYFDGLGRVDITRNEGPGGQIIESKTTFDSRSLVTGRAAPYFVGETPQWTTVTYDPLGRETRVNNSDGTFATKAYTPGLVTLTDERGKVKRNYIDAYGRLDEVQELNGAETYSTTYDYDAAGSLRFVTNHFNHVTEMRYDMLGRKTFMQDPNMGAWSYSYDLAGNLTSQTDGKNQTITFTYDSQSRLTTKRYPNNQQVAWTYDDPGVAYSKGRLTRVVDLATTTSFTYDQLGRVTQTQRVLTGVTYTMSQSYDALGRVTSETFPDNDSVTYSYNEAGWLSAVTGYINTITYNARGQKTQLQYNNGVTTNWTYNAQNFRVANRATSGAAGTFQNLSYGYDNGGNITSITDPVYTADRTFTYDALNRLTSATGNFGPNQSQVTHNYSYDAIGNFLTKAGITYSYTDAAHPSAVTSTSDGKTYTYDANGSMLTAGNRTQTWDYDNRLDTVTVTGGGATVMAYDYTGIRVKKDAPGGTTLFPFSGYQIEPNGVTIKYIRVGIENIASKKSTGEKLFYHNDHLGGVNVITNTSGLLAQLIEYDPWGKISRSEGAGDSLRRFTGKILDPESGLYYYGGRYYDPELGRFISPDPFVQAPDDPQNLNRYSYVRNNPVNLIDPSGYGFWSSIGKFFKKLFRGFTKYVLPGICPVCYAISKIPLKVNAGINIFGGLLMLATGNPAGFFFVASGAMGFGRSNGWQIASGVLSGIGAAASGGGGGGPGNDYPGGGFGGLMLAQALGGSGSEHRHRIDQAGVDFIKRHEGFSPTVYPDPSKRRLPTIGYGHQIFPGENIQGPLTVDEGLRLLQRDIETRVQPYLDRVAVPLFQNQVNALGSFIFNAGGGTFTKYVLPPLNAGDFGAAAAGMGEITGGGRGIPARRREEIEMFITY